MSDFAILALNETTYVIGWGKSAWEKTPSVRGSFYFPDFFLETATPFLTFPYIKKVSFNNIKTKSSPQIGFEEPNKLAFFDMIRAFRASHLKKAVPYTFLNSKTLGNRALFFKCLRHLMAKTKGLPLTPYAFWREGEALLGASPELLFRKRDSLVETVALAGTSFQGKLFTSKDFKEHQFVVEGLKNTLTPFGEVSIGKCFPLDLKTLTHLKTPLAVNLKYEVSFEVLSRALHPTAALGTYPKESSLLREYEALLPRGRFGAPVGFAQGGEADVFVGIRNIQFDKTGMRIGAGCGVIAESSEEEEWLEACAKLRATKSFLFSNF